MAFEFQISDEAEKDILQAYIWYENQQSELGKAFLDELEQAKNQILTNPQAYPVRFKNIVRGYVLNSFPFLLLYILEPNSVNVVAVFHTKRKPEHWKNRLE